MNNIKYTAIACLAVLLALNPAALPNARADDDWEDRWEDYQEALEDREEAEERWEDEQEAIEELREEGIRVGRLGPYGYYGPPHRNRFRGRPPIRYYGYERGPDYRPRYWHAPREYRYYERPHRRYGGEVHAGPARVYYGRHGSVHVGPVHVYW